MALRLGAVVAVLEGGRVLLTQREDFLVWCLPGGGIEEGESPAEAAVREVREETGLEVAVTHLVGTHTRPSWQGGDTCLLVYAARVAGGSLRPDPHEVVEARYFGAGELPELLFPHHRSPIEAALAAVAGAAWRYTGDVERFSSRAEMYALRDRSPLSRQEFFVRHLGGWDAGREVVEVAGVSVSKYAL